MKDKKFHFGTAVIYLILSLWALTTIYPIIWVVINSFKDKRFIVSESFALPMGERFTMMNYQTAFDRLDIFGAYRNSLIISFSVAFVVIILAGMASYGLVRYTFKGRNMLNSLVIASMMFPVFATIVGIPYDEHLGNCKHINTLEIPSGNGATADCR